MKSEARIAIAEACGEKIFPQHDWDARDDRRYFVCSRCDERIGWGDWSKENGVFNERCPGNKNTDYLNDLNAMSRAWMTLSNDDKIRCSQWLIKLSGASLDLKTDIFLPIVLDDLLKHWPEAFLRTIGKWETES